MKRRTAFVILLSAIAISLTSCSILNFGGQDGPTYSYRSYDPTNHRKKGSSDAIYADRIYSDYIKNNVYSMSSTPSLEKAKLLVIPIWFNDSSTFISESKKDNVIDDINTVYFGKNHDAGWASVKSFYEEESHGRLTLDGTVSDWYTVNESYQVYGRDNGHSKTTSLVNSAVNWYFNTEHPEENRTDYDCDQDGYLDAVILIYAAPDYATYGGSANSNLWAYCFWLQNTANKNLSKPGPNVFFWASYDFMYNETSARNRTGYKYAHGDTSNGVNVDGHTYIHEMGHMFGLEDYYDYSSLKYMPAGAFSMQDQNIGGHDPYSSFALGWGKAYIPTTTKTIELKPFVTTGEMIILSPNWNEYNSAFDEYLILEYYTPTGLNYFDSTHAYMRSFPTGSSEPGIRLWHVDARLLYTKTSNLSPSQITCDPNITGGNKVTHMLSNSYNDGSIDMEHLSPLATRDPSTDSYSNYKILELIRNNTSMSIRTKDTLKSTSLFKTGATFKMSDYSKQFVNETKLNNGKTLGFTFKVNSLNNEYASITVTKS